MDKVAIVTGASSGNGRGIALALAEQGATVVVADLRQTPREEGFDADIEVATDALICSRGGHGCFVETDVAEVASVRALVAATVSAFGRVDVLVNNAGRMPVEPVAFVEEDENTYDQVMRVNARGAWLCAREVIGQMLGQDVVGDARGKIVNVVSISGVLTGFPGFTHYAMSKGALAALTLTLAAQYAPEKITVNAIAPGFFPTAMTAQVYRDVDAGRVFEEAVPLRRLGRPEDLGGAAAFLASSAADYVTGQIIAIDGGYTSIAALPTR